MWITEEPWQSSAVGRGLERLEWACRFLWLHENLGRVFLLDVFDASFWAACLFRSRFDIWNVRILERRGSCHWGPWIFLVSDISDLSSVCLSACQITVQEEMRSTIGYVFFPDLETTPLFTPVRSPQKFPWTQTYQDQLFQNSMSVSPLRDPPRIAALAGVLVCSCRISLTNYEACFLYSRCFADFTTEFAEKICQTFNATR